MKSKKLKKWTTLLTCATALTVMTACSQSSSQATGTMSSSKTSAVTATTSKKTNKNNSNYFTSKDSDTSYNESSATKIKLSGSSADVSGDGAALSGSTVTISKAGTYVISGKSDGVQIKVDAGDSDDVHIVLDGVTMTNTNAAINATKAGHVYLTLKDGTTSTLSDSSSNSDEDADAVIFSKGDLTINTKSRVYCYEKYGSIRNLSRKSRTKNSNKKYYKIKASTL